MFFDQLAIREAKRRAFNVLSKPMLVEHVVEHHSEGEGHAEMKMHKKGMKNPFYIEPDLINGPAKLQVEIPYVNTQNSYAFKFSLNGPQQVAAVTAGPGLTQGNNNIQLPQNNIFAIYAIQFWLGYVANDSTGNPTAQLTNYRSYGITSNDEAIYNSRVAMKIEASTLMDLMDAQLFREPYASVNGMWAEAGLVLTDPVRVLTGKLGVFEINLTTLSSLANIVLSGSNIVLSMRLWGMNGQKSGI